MRHAIDREEITGLLLAGGLGTRMGGVDKGLITLNGKPLALYAIEALTAQTGKLIINANRNHEIYRQLGQKFDALVIADTVSTEWSALPGPLAGFYTGLTNCATPYLLTCPCDTPHISLNLARRLSVGLLEANADVAIACQEDEQGRLQKESVFCLMKTTLANSLRDFLSNGRRKVVQWVESQNHAMVRFEFNPHHDAFANINNPEELRRLQLPRSSNR
jgi:molybdenum cofactor guanylyltransferase